MALKNTEKHPSELFWRCLMTREFRFFLDVLILVTAFILAYLARFEFQPSQQDVHSLLVQLPSVILIQFSFLYLCGTYSFFWRYFTLGEMRIFALAFCGSGLIFMVFRLSLQQSYQEWRIPLSIIFIDAVLAFGWITGFRLLRRFLYERFETVSSQAGPVAEKPTKVLLIGAGQTAARAIMEIKMRKDMNFEIKGLVDDDPKKKGCKIQDVRVLGSTEVLPHLVNHYGIEQVIITINKASRKDFKRILTICRQIPVKILVIPSLQRLIQGEFKVSRIRDVQIEDLLGREAVQLDQESIRRFISGKRVMVTGAGGSIGSEMARQIARFQPADLLLVEVAELGLFEIERELKGAYPGLSIVPLVANINDKIRMKSIFSRYQPEALFHAAAHKHVPLMEHNPFEAIKNNCLGTCHLAEMAGEFGVEAFVLISTDKAVNPTSVMGASKRLAELMIQNHSTRYRTRFLAVRLGNVLGSSGSVIPIFKDQILKGGPVTVTHPDMVRYLMTIPEAAQLVLQAGAIGRGGEILLLDMGEPVKIMDLAKEMISLTGLKPFENIDIVCTGMRPGEKLYEELSYKQEHMARTDHPKIFNCKIEPYPEKKIKEMIGHLTYLSHNSHHLELRQYLMQILPEARISLHNPGEENFQGQHEAA
jgi:FlaA1/EpsC-like NDP-sugar epimerase